MVVTQRTTCAMRVGCEVPGLLLDDIPWCLGRLAYRSFESLGGRFMYLWRRIVVGIVRHRRRRWSWVDRGPHKVVVSLTSRLGNAWPRRLGIHRARRLGPEG